MDEIINETSKYLHHKVLNLGNYSAKISHPLSLSPVSTCRLPALARPGQVSATTWPAAVSQCEAAALRPQHQDTSDHIRANITSKLGLSAAKKRSPDPQ